MPETIERESKVKNRKSLCLVIPTYNERENITNLLVKMEDLRISLPLDLTIVVVDDNSEDDTADAVREAMRKSERIKLIERPEPLGIGSAYVEGFKYGLEMCKCDYLGEMDADLQHPPEALLRMCEAAVKGKDVVIASRYIEGGGSSGWSFSRRLASRSANLLSKIFIRAPVADATSGFRILSAKAIYGLFEFELSSKGYAFQVESIYIYHKLGMSFTEVPYVFEERRVGKTKLRAKEMLRFAFTVVRLGIFGVRKRS